jgi:hypothetical protein
LLRTLGGACRSAPCRRRAGEDSVILTSASGDRWAAVASSRPTWCVVSLIPALAWRPEPAHFEPALRTGATRLRGGARAPCGPAPRRRRHTRQSPPARQPTPRGDEKARGSTRPCRFPKRAPRAGHLHPPWRSPGRPVLPWRSVRVAQHPPARGLHPQPPGQLRARTSGMWLPGRHFVNLGVRRTLLGSLGRWPGYGNRRSSKRSRRWEFFAASAAP